MTENSRHRYQQFQAMKITSTLLLSVATLSLNAGAVTVSPDLVFTETFGTPAGTTAIATYETNDGFDNDGFTFSGTGDVRTTTASTGYAGASGSGNVFLTNSGSSTLRIDGISTVGNVAGTMNISFGAVKSTTASDMTTLLLDYSTDGSSWSSLLIPAQPTGSGTAVWRLISLTATSIPISNTLSLRWTNADTSPQYRIDDITLTGTLVPETSAALLGSLGLLGLLRRRR